MDDIKEAELLNEVEIWVSTTLSTVWLWVEDRLSGRNGAWKHVAVGGPDGNPRIQLTVRERRYNQEQIPERNAHLDPFLNGKLICRQGRQQSPNGFTDEDLIRVLQVEDDALFTQALRSPLMTEIILRRLEGLAERHAASYRREQIVDLVDDLYRVGSTQRSMRSELATPTGVGNGTLMTG